MIAKAVGDDATYRRKNRNQITSNARRMKPVPKLTKRRRHGGRYLTSRRRGNVRCQGSAMVSPLNFATNKAATAATQLAKPATKDVPRRPNAAIRQPSPSTAPTTAPKVFDPYRKPIARPKSVRRKSGSSTITGNVKPMAVVGTSRIRKERMKRSPRSVG